MKSAVLVVSLLWSVASGFVVGPPRSFVLSPSRLFMTSSSTSASSATAFLKDLLEDLKTPNGGQRLLDSSSDSWRNAIYEAVGAPAHADPKIVAKALTDAMSAPDNQFAILMGKAGPFEPTFPAIQSNTTMVPAGSNVVFEAKWMRWKTSSW